NKLSNGIQERWQELFEASQPYLIKLATDNGVIFKNGTGQSIVTPTLYKGGKSLTANVTWRWSLDGAVKTGMTYSVRGADVTDTSTLTVAAYIGNDEVAVDELTFVNVLDGRDGGVGPKGDPGNDGVAGRDGNKVYTSIYEMSANQSGIYLSDLTPTANPANLPPIGSIVIAPSGKMYPIIALNPTSTPPSYTAGVLVGNIKGPQGDNGQTPVVHWAYSDTADGTGLTTSDNGQRYIGHYSDYTQADSTDKTKYKWADRWAQIDSGFINLYALSSNSLIQGNHISGFSQDISTGVISMKTTGSDPFVGTAVAHPQSYADQFGIKIPVVEGRSICIQITNPVFTKNYVSYFNSSNATVKSFSSHSSNKFIVQPNQLSGVAYITLRFGAGNSNVAIGTMLATKVKVEYGTLHSDWSPALEDVGTQIDSKADQALTQEQLNTLNERAGIIQAELEAKASLDTVNNILKQIKDMKVADEATWAKVEKDLITHLQRVIKIETNLGDQAQRWNAVDTFMQVSNDGLSLGKADGSSSMLFSPDGRITMFSSGTPVMYVDKGVIHIDNGIFSKTVQIGRFREEQYHNNPDINVKRCVG
ncbi:hypothetical protein ACSBRS_010860, partial [Streptococcus suis]